MNINNIILITIGVIGIGFSVFLHGCLGLGLFFHPSATDPARLKWLAIGNFAHLPPILSIAAIGFGIYNWR